MPPMPQNGGMPNMPGMPPMPPNVDFTEKLNQYLPKMQAYAEKMNQSQREGKNPMEEMMSKMMGGQCGQTAGAGENPMADMMSKMMSGQGQASNGGCGKGQGWRGNNPGTGCKGWG